MKVLLAIALLLAPVAVAAKDYALGDLIVGEATALETAATAMTGAGYMTITNAGGTPDRLIAVSGDFPRVMLHETVMENDVATMVHLMAVDLPAGETVTFAPGGKHVMFMGLNGDPFEVGEMINVRLTFEVAGDLDVAFEVVPRAAEETPSAN